MAQRFSGERVVAGVLLVLVALVGGLVLQARLLERSHRVTAENALRDYAALAGWQYNERVQAELSTMAHNALAAVHPVIHDEWHGVVLPDPDLLLQHRRHDCRLVIEARLAFRIDINGSATFSGDAPPSVRDAIIHRFTNLARQGPTDREVLRLLVDSIAGERRAIAYGFARRAGSVAAVYGIEADASSIDPVFTHAFVGKPLLPPSLLRGRPLDSVLAVSVRSPDGGLLAAFGKAEGRLAASTRSSESSGGLITQVVLQPAAAGALLIGGLPATRLPMLIGFLVASIALAAVALAQIRRARELARLRARFVANVSHELRTPLAQISMFSETLLLGRQRSSGEAREFLSIIFREARRLNYLVESVLTFSRGEAARRAGTALGPVDVSAEVGDTVKAFAPLAAAADMTIASHLEENSQVDGSGDALRQIVINLLDNAVKFGPRRQTIAVSVQRVAADVVIAVTDQGPGVASKDRLRVFEPYVQAETPRDRSANGTGIGLAVVAELVALMRGRVWIEAGVNGVGARLSCAIPALAPWPRARAPHVHETQSTPAVA